MSRSYTPADALASEESTWPPWLSSVLEELADAGAFQLLWTLLLSLSFPEKDGYTVLEDSGAEGASFGFSTVVNSEKTPIFVLSFAFPSPAYKFQLNGMCDLMDVDHVYWISAYGLNIATLHASVSQLLTFDISEYTPIAESLSFPSHHEKRENWNIHLLEPEGYRRFTEHVARAKSMVVPCDVGLQNVDESYLTNGPLSSAMHDLQIGPFAPPLKTDEAKPFDNWSVWEDLSLGLLPPDMVLCVMDYLSSNDLRSLAGTSKAFNQFVSHRLWTNFTIGSTNWKLYVTPSSQVHGACDAILRIPNRAVHILRLDISPCTWRWTPDLLQKLENVWVAVPNLVELRLHTFKEGSVAHEWNDFSPLLRTLVSHGSHLRLRVFECQDWLRPTPTCYLYQFLRTQSTLEELINVDVFASRIPPHEALFLPKLKILTCSYTSTGAYFLSQNTIQTLTFTQSVDPDHLAGFDKAFSSALPHTPELSLAVSPSFARDWRPYLTALQKLSRALPDLKMLCLQKPPPTTAMLKSCSEPLFPRLESIEFRNPGLRSRVDIDEWASLISSELCTITFAKVEMREGEVKGKQAREDVRVYRAVLSDLHGRKTFVQEQP